ncbi:hypothetical protein M0805_005188, partial [Coniferiporia weirii]
IQKFKKVEKRIRPVEGGVRLMDALTKLEYAALDDYMAFPIFLKAQETAQNIKYNNMLTAATFFSAVTATSLQLSYAYNTNPNASFGVVVNTLWFVALVFSTASSLSSLVGLMWYQEIRRIQLLPDWAKLWVEYGPTVSLAAASAAFSAGLCLFAFSSSQHTITSSLTTAFTAAHAVALFVPLCLYSSNPLSRFLLGVFTTSLEVFTTFLKVFTTPFSYCKEVCLRYWYLRRVPRQDRARVVYFLHAFGSPWSEVNRVCMQLGVEVERTGGRTLDTRARPTVAMSLTGDAGPGSSSSLIEVAERSIKAVWTSMCSTAHSIVAWLVTRWPDWLVLRRRKTCAIKESSDMEQAHEADEKAATLDELERHIGSQGDAGDLEVQKPVVTEDQGTEDQGAEEPRALIHDSTDPDQSAALAAKELGVRVDHRLNTRLSLELVAQEPTTVISPTGDVSTNLNPSPVVQCSDKGLENVERLETDTPRKLYQLQKEELGPPSNSSVQEGVEAYSIGASNSALKLSVVTRESPRRAVHPQTSRP